MVTTQQLTQNNSEDKNQLVITAQTYFKSARSYLDLSPPRLICISGLSGTGKSTLAAHLAPSIGNKPGALHLRSDLERKALFSVAETDRLNPKFYTASASKAVYHILQHKARLALKAGHSVILDAVFSTPEERLAVEHLAHELNVAFTGLWLNAPGNILKTRVTERLGDASDATPEVVDMQLQQSLGEIAWHEIDAGGTEMQTVIEASRRIEVKI